MDELQEELCGRAESSHEADKRAWDVRRGQLYGVTAAVGLSLGFVGFIPGYVSHFRGQAWFYEAISCVNFAGAVAASARFGEWWEALLTVHAATAVAGCARPRRYLLLHLPRLLLVPPAWTVRNTERGLNLIHLVLHPSV